jgi:hypothetical protein
MSLSHLQAEKQREHRRLSDRIFCRPPPDSIGKSPGRLPRPSNIVIGDGAGDRREALVGVVFARNRIRGAFSTR